LQSDSNVKKISSHITKKVADKLEELFKNSREDFEKKWDDIRIFIEYGMLSDEKFNDRAQKFNLFKNTEGKYFTQEEYKTHVEGAQKDKDDNLIYLYSTNPEEQHSFVTAAKDKGYDVLLLDNALDAHFINMLESKLEKTKFVRVDSDTVDKLIKKDEEIPSKLNDEEKEKLKPMVEKFVNDKRFTVQLESLSETEAPIIVTRPEFMRRMKDMSMVGGGNDFMREMPDSLNLVVNTNHPLISKVLNLDDEEKQSALVKQATDLALLSQNMLKGEPLTKFVKRSFELID
jgi:molecular chaperone HtpG